MWGCHGSSSPPEIREFGSWGTMIAMRSNVTHLRASAGAESVGGHALGAAPIFNEIHPLRSAARRWLLIQATDGSFLVDALQAPGQGPPENNTWANRARELRSSPQELAAAPAKPTNKATLY